MARPDRFVALAILVFSIAYLRLAIEYPLLPFEFNLDFRPNTMPMGLGSLGVLFSLAVLVFPGGETGLSDDADGWRDFDWLRGFAIVALVVTYALLLRPAGFIGSTTVFLVSGAVIIGERQFTVLIPVALVAAGGTWYLVDRVLGIFLKPWPAF